MGKRGGRPATAEQTIEAFDSDLIALAQYLRDDPIAFCRIALGFQPHSKQAEFMRLPVWDNYHVMLPWGRQFGKSFIVSAMIAYCLFAFPDFRVYLFSPAEDQTRTILDQATKFFRRSDILKRLVKAKVSGDRLDIGGDDWGSYVELVKIGHKGKYGRGRSTSGKGLIVYEEFNVLEAPDVIKQTLTPIIRSGGGEVILSSPGDPGGEMHRLYELWSSAAKENDRYRVIECRYDETDHLSDEFVEDCKREYSDWMFRRELLGEWVTPADTWFEWADIQRCLLPVKPEYNAKDTFVWAIDFGGRGRSALQVLIARYKASPARLEVVECLPYYLTNHKYHRHTDDAEEIADGWQRIEDILLDLRERYPPTWVGVDPNTENSLSARLANTYRFPICEIPIGGYAVKERLYTSLQNGIRECRIKWNDSRITNQLRSFCPRKKDNGDWDFPKANTDIVVCMVNLYQYLGDREEMPFAVITGKRSNRGETITLW